MSNVDNKHFPNGFRSWMETFYEAVLVIEDQRRVSSTVMNVQNQLGMAGLYDLAEELTDRFEQENLNREWDGEFYEEVETFMRKALA